MDRHGLGIIAALALQACCLPFGDMQVSMTGDGFQLEGKAGSGNPADMSLDLADITGVSCGLPGTLRIQAGERGLATLTTDQAVAAGTRMTVEDGMLRVEADHACEGHCALTAVTVELPVSGTAGRLALSEVVSRFGCEVVVDADLQADGVQLGVEGAGLVKARQLFGADVRVSIAGAGEVDVQAALAPEVMLEVAGAGEIDVYSVRAEDLYVEMAGAGAGEIRDIVARRVRAEVAGVGDLVLQGIADELRAELAGIGSIDASDLAVSKVDKSVAGMGTIHL